METFGEQLPEGKREEKGENLLEKSEPRKTRLLRLGFEIVQEYGYDISKWPEEIKEAYSKKEKEIGKEDKGIKEEVNEETKEEKTGEEETGKEKIVEFIEKLERI